MVSVSGEKIHAVSTQENKREPKFMLGYFSLCQKLERPMVTYCPVVSNSYQWVCQGGEVLGFRGW